VVLALGSRVGVIEETPVVEARLKLASQVGNADREGGDEKGGRNSRGSGHCCGKAQLTLKTERRRVAMCFVGN